MAGLATSFYVPDEEVRYIKVAERSFLTPIPESLLNSEFEGVCSAEMATEPSKTMDPVFGFS